MKNAKDIITGSIEESIKVKNAVKELLTEQISRAAEECIRCLKDGNKILIAGNGGSAAQASHFAAELVGRYNKPGKGLACLSLATDMSLITAWVNDYEFDTLFSRQISALGRKDDVFIGISTSGNSENIIKAIDEAKNKGIRTIMLLGKDGGRTKGMADIEIIVPGKKTARIQESHIMILHIICDFIDDVRKDL